MMIKIPTDTNNNIKKQIDYRLAADYWNSFIIDHHCINIKMYMIKCNFFYRKKYGLIFCFQEKTMMMEYEI